MRSLVVSLLRLIVVALPLAWLFTLLPNAQDMVWWAFPVAEAAALAVALVFMKQISARFLHKREPADGRLKSAALRGCAVLCGGSRPFMLL